MSARKSVSVKERIKAAKRPTKIVTVYLRGDLVAQIESLDAELARLQRDASRKGDRRLGSSSDGVSDEERVLAEAIEIHRAEMEESAIELTLRAHEKTAWKKLIRTYPPREGNNEDRQYDCNVDEFFPVALREATIMPELDEEDWAGIEEATSGGQWGELTNAVTLLNAYGVSVPFSQRASLILSTNNENGAPPAPSE